MRIEYSLCLSRENTLAQIEGTQPASNMKLIRKHKKSTLAFAESLELEDKQEAANSSVALVSVTDGILLLRPFAAPFPSLSNAHMFF